MLAWLLIWFMSWVVIHTPCLNSAVCKQRYAVAGRMSLVEVRSAEAGVRLA